MNSYVTGTVIKQLRETVRLTQAELAERIGVSSKTVSKWETGKGLPDITLLQPLAQALGISQRMVAACEAEERRPSAELAKRIGAVLGIPWVRFYEDEEESAE